MIKGKGEISIDYHRKSNGVRYGSEFSGPLTPLLIKSLRDQVDYARKVDLREQDKGNRKAYLTYPTLADMREDASPEIKEQHRLYKLELKKPL